VYKLELWEFKGCNLLHLEV